MSELRPVDGLEWVPAPDEVSADVPTSDGTPLHFDEDVPCPKCHTGRLARIAGGLWGCDTCGVLFHVNEIAGAGDDPP